MSKLTDLAELEGFDSEIDMMQDYMIESLIPAICINPNCNYTAYLEPDCRKGHCEECATQTMQSCMVLAGVI